MLNHINRNAVNRALSEHILELLPDIGFKDGTAKGDAIRFSNGYYLEVVIEGEFSGCWAERNGAKYGDAFALVEWALDMDHFEAKHWSYTWLIEQEVPKELLLNGR